jgi:hypothetical protein
MGTMPVRSWWQGEQLLFLLGIKPQSSSTQPVIILTVLSQQAGKGISKYKPWLNFQILLLSR